jgi:hypothetical protein
MAAESDHNAASYMNRCAIAAAYAMHCARGCSVVALRRNRADHKIIQSIKFTTQTTTKTASATDEHRKRCLRQHAMGLAAKHQPLQASPPMRRHDDQVTAPLFGRFENAVCRFLMANMNRLARNSIGLSANGDSRKRVKCPFGHFCVTFNLGESEHIFG